MVKLSQDNSHAFRFRYGNFFFLYFFAGEHALTCAITNFSTDKKILNEILRYYDTKELKVCDVTEEGGRVDLYFVFILLYRSDFWL